MSYQMIMEAGKATTEAFQGTVAGIQGINAAIAAGEQGVMGAKIRGAQGRAAAAGTGLAIAEDKYATQQQEIARRREIARLWQANAIDLVGRGGQSDGTDSTAVLQAENARLGEKDVTNIRLMGESRVSKLSFRQTQQNLGAMASELEALNIGEATSRQIASFATSMFFKLLDPIGGSGVHQGGASAGAGSTPGSVLGNAPSFVGGGIGDPADMRGQPGYHSYGR